MEDNMALTVSRTPIKICRKTILPCIAVLNSTFFSAESLRDSLWRATFSSTGC
jgi:hypothetical protein